MKKTYSFILIIILSFTMSTTAFASGNVMEIKPESSQGNPSSGDVDVNYKMNENYTVIIPTTIEISSNYNGDLVAVCEIKAESVYIPHGTTLNVSLGSTNFCYDNPKGWRLVDISTLEEAISTNTLAYTIGTENNINDITNNNQPVLTFESGEITGKNGTYTGEKTQDLYFTISDQITKAGIYEDTLTFTVNVEDTVTP